MPFFKTGHYRKLLWISIAALIITMMVSTVMQTGKLTESLGSGTMPHPSSIDYGYAQRPLLTFIHILPGMIWLILGAFQFMPFIRRKYIRWHRFAGRLYILVGMLVGITAIIMCIWIRFGGYVETAAVTVFGSYLLYSLWRAYIHIRKKEISRHREWMLRAYATGLAVATMRPIIGLFFAFTNIPFSQFFGYVFWMAFLLHTLVAEWWIRHTRKATMMVTGVS